jgi:hypothetical protein
MPLPKPRSGEKQNDFVSRCMDNDTMKSEYPDQAQRTAVCYSQWRRRMQNQKYLTNKVTTNNYSPRYEQHMGRKHVIVPVVMMMEGVHHGSHGPLFHPAEELGKFPESWNGIPVLIEHPERDGNNVSANDPDIIDSTVVGRVYNTMIEEGKLKGEAWIDELKLEEISPLALQYIRSAHPLDVSLGMFTEDEFVDGQWNNESYIAIAHNHRPDHLALLPGGTGACSWADGCGIRANKKGGEEMDLEKTVKELSGQGYSVIQMNREGMAAIVQAVREKIDSMDSETKVHYLEEVFDDYAIYRVQNRTDEGLPNISRLYKRAYQIHDDNLVEFTDDPIPVVRKVEYQETTTTYKKKGEGVMLDKKKDGQPCCPEKVEMLIQSDHSTFVEGDREWLEGMEESYIDKMIAMQTDYENKVEEYEEKLKKAKEEEDKPIMNEEQAIEVLESQLSDPEKFKKFMPKEMKEQFEHGMKLYEEHRSGIVSKILACTEAYTEDELKEMETASLEKLSKAVKAPADYSAQGGPSDTNKVEPLIPPQL